VTSAGGQQIVDFATAETEFVRSWQNPEYTQIELAPVDVNRVLREHYALTEPLTFTRAMLWDVEVRKARDPDRYIPGVVRDGRIWGRRFLENGDESFLRASHQRQWLGGERGTVLERVWLSHERQTVVFLGTAELPDTSGTLLRSDERQPLFHVEHGVGGTETRPLSTWRIVHLTNGKDQRLIERFARFQDEDDLPEFVTLYIQRDLQVGLTKKAMSVAPASEAFVDSER
jgi:hypothetical protein